MSADLSRGRRRWAERVLRASSSKLATISRADQVVYVVGLLVARDDGDGLVVDEDEWVAALDDASVVQAARTVLAKAGYVEEVA